MGRRGDGMRNSRRTTAVTPAKAGGQLWTVMPPQPVENGIDRRGCRAVQGWAPDQVRGDEMGQQPPQHYRHPRRTTTVTPAKAGGHPWLAPQPQQVENGIDRRGCRAVQGWAPDQVRGDPRLRGGRRGATAAAPPPSPPQRRGIRGPDPLPVMPLPVMPGLVPGIRFHHRDGPDGDARNKSGHDEGGRSGMTKGAFGYDEGGRSGMTKGAFGYDEGGRSGMTKEGVRA